MLCRACRVHVRRDFPYCLHCGTLRKGATVTEHPAPALRRPASETGTPLTGPVTTIGREPGNDVVIDDPSVSRHHARITRGDAGFVIEDLDSFNGTGIGDRTLHGERATLTDSVLLHIGDVPLVFEQPRSAAIGSKTMVKGTEHTLLSAGGPDGDPAPTATEPLAVKPRRRGGWALKRVPDDRGREVWVLRNTRTGSYLELDDRDVFLWHRLDGQNTIRDLLFAYAQAYGELALPRIEQTLHAFASVDLVRGLRNQAPAAKPSLLRRFGRALMRALLRMEISIKGIDPFMARLYRAFGWRFFTRTGVCLLWTLIFAGLYGFWVARSHQRLFDVGGAGVWGAVIVGAGYLFALMVHEGAHALAVKSYGRTVTRGGFMVMMAMPFAFVDTSDMWFGSRWSRLVVTLSGPLSTAAIAGGLSLGAAYLPGPAAAGICFQLAFGLYLNTLYNINPLMPLDGYQALSDALRLPRLRQEAMAYATKGIWRDLAARRRPGIKQVGLAAYGLMVVVGTYLFLVLGVVAWRSRLGGLVHEHLRPPLDTVALVGLIALLTFPVWFRYAKRLSSLVFRRRPSVNESTVDSPVAVSA